MLLHSPLVSHDSAAVAAADSVMTGVTALLRLIGIRAFIHFSIKKAKGLMSESVRTWQFLILAQIIATG